MSLIGVLALAISQWASERIARHARILGQLALIWINMAFWIGSLSGDVVGFHLWGPRWETVTAGIEGFPAEARAWGAAVRAFRAQAMVIPPDAFAALWAMGVIAVGA